MNDKPPNVAPVEKAYHDDIFLKSPEARPLRLLAEYLEPRQRFARYHIEDTIVFFGGARLLSKEVAEAKLAEARVKNEGIAKAEMALQLAEYYEATRELARRLTEWSKSLSEGQRRFVICSGGGPGIMEAANRGAAEAKGLNVGLNISLPFEQEENPYITRELTFNFHYFFMRKFWFAYLAKAMIIMPGGMGTLDEFFEILTLIQTGKLRKKMPLVLFGKKFWNEVINFDALVRFGTIAEKDLELFLQTDSLDEAFAYITDGLVKHGLAKPGATL